MGSRTIKSERAQNLINIASFANSQDYLFMSGTPFKAYGSELITFLMCADPSFDIRQREDFMKMFGTKGDKGLEILSARVGRLVHTIPKEAVFNNKMFKIDVKVSLPKGSEFTLKTLKGKMMAYVTERVEHYKKVGPDMCVTYLRLRAEYGRLASDQKAFQLYCERADLIRSTSDLRSVHTIMEPVNLYEKKVLVPLISNEDKKVFRDCFSVYKYVSLKIQGEALGRILGGERTRCNLEMIKNLNSGLATSQDLGFVDKPLTIQDIFDMSDSKVVFFTDYVQVLHAMQHFLRQIKIKAPVVYRETNNELAETLEKVEKDPNILAVIATFKSLSTAVPLTFCDTEVFLNLPYRDYIYTQAVARVDRLGQKNDVKIFHYVLDTKGEPNISTRSKEIMDWSREMVEKLMGVHIPDEPKITEQEFIQSFSEGFVTPGSTFSQW